MAIGAVCVFGAFVVTCLCQQVLTLPSVLYVVATSVVAFCVYGFDKLAAMRRWKRISERSLLGLALIGGWPGAALAIALWHHKSRKSPFLIWFVVAAISNAALFVSLVLCRAAVLTL